MRELRFFCARKFFFFAGFEKYLQLVLVRIHSDVVSRDIIRHQQVAIFLRQLALRVPPQLLGFGGEADDKTVVRPTR